LAANSAPACAPTAHPTSLTEPALTEAGGILITRPEPGAYETAQRVAALGFQPVMAPLLDIAPLPVSWPASGRIQAILVTSGSAVPLLPVSHHHLPLFAVGGATAARARAAGFSHVSSADGDAKALAALVAQSCNRLACPLLLACGRNQGTAIAADLRARGFAVLRRVVYLAMPLPYLPAAALDAFNSGTLAAALFFSAETARQCVHLMQSARLDAAVRSVDALAISETVGVALQVLPWRRVRIAARPNQEAMLALLR
jgi:uroporphyrinogen-III synthase